MHTQLCSHCLVSYHLFLATCTWQSQSLRFWHKICNFCRFYLLWCFFLRAGYVFREQGTSLSPLCGKLVPFGVISDHFGALFFNNMYKAPYLRVARLTYKRAQKMSLFNFDKIFSTVLCIFNSSSTHCLCF